MPERLRFIKRDDNPDTLAILGGDAQYFIGNYSRLDMAGFEKHRLNELLKQHTTPTLLTQWIGSLMKR